MPRRHGALALLGYRLTRLHTPWHGGWIAAAYTGRAGAPPLFPMPLTPPLSASPLHVAERALRKPSSTVWLQRVCVRTAHFDEALAFYTSAIGLTLGGLDAQAGTSRLRAHLLDAEGCPVFELIEADGTPPSLAHELAFGMPLRSWQLLRARLDNAGIAYRAAGTTLYLHDVDGTPLRLESIADGYAA